ncbi:hypothetical protein BX666DRAFT_1879104 [Dichotomocladium elegans]|nr:hypothetical protein BX666DRAFT_1879104 [Dichotomocladium elegans]
MPYSRAKVVDLTNDDFTDLDSILDENGRFTPGSAGSLRRHGYRISFRSVDDDELQRIMRSLVTPVPNSDRHLESGGLLASGSPSPAASRSGPADRSESVMLFRNLNNGFTGRNILTTVQPEPYYKAASIATITNFDSDQKARSESSQERAQILPGSTGFTEATREARPALRSKQRCGDRPTTTTIIGDNNGHRECKSAQKTEELLQAIRRSEHRQPYGRGIDSKNHDNASLKQQQQQQQQQHSARFDSVDNEMRHSMDFGVLLELKKDTDAILERRASLLSKMRNCSLADSNTSAGENNKNRRKEKPSSSTSSANQKHRLSPIRTRTFSMPEKQASIASSTLNSDILNKGTEDPQILKSPAAKQRRSYYPILPSRSPEDSADVMPSSGDVAAVRKSPQQNATAEKKFSRRATLASHQDIRPQHRRDPGSPTTARPGYQSRATDISDRSSRRNTLSTQSSVFTTPNSSGDEGQSNTEKSVAEMASDILANIRQRNSRVTAAVRDHTRTSNYEDIRASLRSRRMTVSGSGDGGSSQVFDIKGNGADSRDTTARTVATRQRSRTVLYKLSRGHLD